MPNATALLTPFQTLTVDEQTQGGFTHKAIIKSTDLVAQAAGNVFTWNLAKCTAGFIVMAPCIFVVTPFVFSDATILTTTLAVGDGSSVTTYLTAQNVAGAGQTTPVAANAVYVDTTRVAVAYAVSTNGQMNTTVTVTAAKNLNTATAGEVHIFWEMRQVAELCYPQQ